MAKKKITQADIDKLAFEINSIGKGELIMLYNRKYS